MSPIDIAQLGNYVCMNRTLVHVLGVREALLLLEHVYCGNRFGDVYYRSRAQLKNSTSISEKQQKRIEDKLIKLELLSSRTPGSTGYANEYSVNNKNIIQLVNDPEKYLSNYKRYDFVAKTLNSMELSTPVVATAPPRRDDAPINNNIKNNNYHTDNSTPNGVETKRKKVGIETKRKKVGIETKRKKVGIQKRDLSVRIQYLDPMTVQIVEYWNSKGNLKEHQLKKSKRGRYILADQFKYIQKLDKLVIRIQAGDYFTNCKDLASFPQLQKLRPSIHQIKRAIDRFSIDADPAYNDAYEYFRKMRIQDFFVNQRMEVHKDSRLKYPYKYKYKFFYYLMHKPEPISKTPTRRNTQYITQVNNVIRMLRQNGAWIQNDRNWNDVVKTVERAIELVKGRANGSSSSIIGTLHVHLNKCMGSNVKLNHLWKTVEYRLIPYLEEKRYI